MHVVPEADITMFARGLLGRHGPQALQYAQDRSRQLAGMNDAEGADVWARVANAVADRIGQAAGVASFQ